MTLLDKAHAITDKVMDSVRRVRYPALSDATGIPHFRIRNVMRGQGHFSWEEGLAITEAIKALASCDPADKAST